MKVFLNLLAGTTGGQVTRAKAFLDRIMYNNSGVQLVVVKDPNVLNEYQSSPQVEIINIPIGNGKFKIIKRLWWETFTMISMIRKSKADIFITFSHFLPFRKFNVPTFVGVSNLAPFSSIALMEESISTRWKFKLLGKTILSSVMRANAVMALSHTAEKVLTEHGVHPEKIVVIPIGVDHLWSVQSETTEILQKLGIDTPFYLYVSHFYRYKNHLRLIEAYAQLPSSILEQKKLVLVGKFENYGYFEEVKQLIVSKKLKDKVLLIPGQDMVTLRALYQSTELFIFPSLVENCPNILLEAMAAGAPVATINIAPMTEYCEEAAAYFDGTSVTDIARTIRELADDSDRTDYMRTLSKQRAGNYSWDIFVNTVIAEANKIISSSHKQNI
jgi:glycosyltransferase involved in cell wall biosynthesis